MTEVYSLLPDEVTLMGSVHNELILEAPEDLATKMAAELKKVMIDVDSELLKPVPVDAEVESLKQK